MNILLIILSIAALIYLVYKYINLMKEAKQQYNLIVNRELFEEGKVAHIEPQYKINVKN